MRSQRLANLAELNHKIRKEKFAESIKASFDGTELIDRESLTGSITTGRYGKTEIDIVPAYIQDYMRGQMQELTGKTAILNFASFSNPGGRYMDGSMAQEEALCHASTLYEVLINKPLYYEYNNKHKNRGLYLDRCLYTPMLNVLDDDNNEYGFVDIITCAAPNASVGIRYGNFTDEECREAMLKRIIFVMAVAAQHEVDNLILGAFGCGVFRNNPAFVASAFYSTHASFDGCFKTIKYVMPKDNNFDVFVRTAVQL